MKKKRIRYCLIPLLCAALISGMVLPCVAAEESADEIIIQAEDYSEDSSSVLKVEDGIVMTNSEGAVNWKFQVPKDGLYNLKFQYYPTISKGGSIERTIYIDGQLPCEEVSNITFSRAYKNAEEIQTDANGNHIRPEQTEVYMPMEMIVRDPAELIAKDLEFYLTAGEHILTLVSNRELLDLKTITFSCVREMITYEDYLKKYEKNGNKNEKVKTFYVEGEDAALKSNSTLYPITDKDVSTTPQDPVKIRLNSIGSSKWQTAGQWLEWEFEIEKAGFYHITPRFKQNAYDGAYVTRRILIDNEIPFAEASNICFEYDNSWQTESLGDGQQEYQFYFTEGTHTLRMYVTLGDMAKYITRVSDVLNSLNEDYLSILIITGSNPDIYRDYSFTTLIPEVIEDFEKQREELLNVIEDIKKETNTGGSYTSSLLTMTVILEKMIDDPESIAKYFTTYKDDLTALGDWLQQAQLQPLEIEKIYFSPANLETPDGEKGLFGKLIFKVKAFFLSFFEDYETIGAGITEEDIANNNVITVWIATGRDQSELIQYLSDNYFTTETGIKVKLQLVSAGSILPSVLGGNAPDIVMSVGSDAPLNYAIRNAVADLTQFEDLDEVLERFSPEVMKSYTFNDSVYALPETMSFPMMFVRQDVFEEMGIEAPQTWDAFYDTIADLQANHLQIGFPVNTEISTISNANTMGYKIFLYQNGGSIYNADLTKSVMDSEISVQAFNTWTDLFTLYGLPVSYNSLNRFRSGEMPLVIADYTFYNSLAVFAPEIKGEWTMLPIPGTVDADGNINYSAPCDSSAIMIMEQSENKEKAWEFLKWWTEAETQGKYANEMEGILGVSAKQPVSNLEALSRLSWSEKEYASLSKQMQQLAGTPELPGSYMMSRTIDFSFNSVYTQNSNPTTVISDYLSQLNEEIQRKRKEFGL